MIVPALDILSEENELLQPLPYSTSTLQRPRDTCHRSNNLSTCVSQGPADHCSTFRTSYVLPVIYSIVITVIPFC